MNGDRLGRRGHSRRRRRPATLGGTLVKGLAAGAAGVAAMTLAEKVEQSLTGRPNSFVPAHTLRRLLGLPARPDHERVALNWAMHWGQGIALGPLRMLMAERGMRGSVASFLFLNLRLLNDQVFENATGAGAPPWTWPRDEQRIDLLHKAIYAFATGAVADRLAATADRDRRSGHVDERERLRPASGPAANRAYGVRVRLPGRPHLRDTPVLVVAEDEQDAEIIAAEAAGSNAQAEVLRELTDAEIAAHGLDLRERGRVTSLPVLNL